MTFYTLYASTPVSRKCWRFVYELRLCLTYVRVLGVEGVEAVESSAGSTTYGSTPAAERCRGCRSSVAATLSKSAKTAALNSLANVNALITLTTKPARSHSDDLLSVVVGRANLERRADHHSVETPIINRLFASKQLIPKDLEAALHYRCTEVRV